MKSKKVNFLVFKISNLDRLYWISDISPPKCKTSQAFYFCIDDNLVYEPFYEDFGPLNLAMTHKYCMEVDNIMTVS